MTDLWYEPQEKMKIYQSNKIEINDKKILIRVKDWSRVEGEKDIAPVFIVVETKITDFEYLQDVIKYCEEER